MAVTALAGTVGFGAQTNKTTTATTWYRHKAIMADLAVLDDTRLGPPEIGGVPVPTFPYKAGVMVGGGLTIQPRLEDTIGWVLYGALGELVTTGTGPYTHTFTFLNADATAVKWMSFRKHIPRKDNAVGSDLGEIYSGCKVLGLTLTLANDAPVTARIDVLGRTFDLDHDPTAWTWANTFEQFASIPVGCQVAGYVKMPLFSATELPVVAGTVSFQNIPLDTRQERVFGDPYLEDITIVMRQITFDLLLKWNDPELYASILTGTTTGTVWTSTPFTSSLELLVNSPGNIPTFSAPYSLKISAPSIMLSIPEGITLAGNQAVMMRVTGTGLEPAAGEYVTMVLTNDTTSYTWP